MMVFPKEFFEKFNFGKKLDDNKKCHSNLMNAPKGIDLP